MKYDIHITGAAENDMNETADYIDLVLMNPKAADDLLNEADEKINKLALFPERHQMTGDPVLDAWGIRFISINNYLVFYIISDEEGKVYILRFLYCRRDWVTILRKGIELRQET